MSVFDFEKLYQLIASYQSKNFLIAYSGGLDSHVLLHAMAALRVQQPAIQLYAIHIHHGLSPHANAWAKHCEAVCRELKIPLQIFKVDLTAACSGSASIEAVARAARYKIFKQQLMAHQCLLTAHTQNDQAETLLLQLFRGAGPKGLAAMPISTAFAAGFHWRPLLNMVRAQLETYAREHKLQWIEDESNADSRFSRNYLRHEIIPLLSERWPALHETLSRSARHCAEASELLHELAQQDFLQNDMRCATNELALSIAKLLQFSLARQRNIIRYWLEQLKLPLPSTVKLAQLQQEVLYCAQDATPLVQWPGVEIRRYDDALYAMAPLDMHDSTMVMTWDINKPLKLPNNLGVLIANEVFEENNYPTGLVTVRFRQGGEKCRLKGHHCTSKLKKLFQQWGVPPWLRDRVPLVYVDNKLVVIVGYGICD